MTLSDEAETTLHERQDETPLLSNKTGSIQYDGIESDRDISGSRETSRNDDAVTSVIGSWYSGLLGTLPRCSSKLMAKLPGWAVAVFMTG